MMRISVGFPNVDAEKSILLGEELHEKLAKIPSVLDTAQLKAFQQAIEEVTVSEQILEYVIGLCQVSRDDNFNGNPLSPRAGKSLLKAAKAWTFIDGRDFVTPEDVQAVFSSVCEHRLDAGLGDVTSKTGKLSQVILSQVDVLNPLAG